MTNRRIDRLRCESRGYPVPWFVAWIDGVPDFRVIAPGKVEQAVRLGLCWVCGDVLGARYQAFTVGPMCAINRTSAEPPSHRDCAIYSAEHCPFLTKPSQRRRGGELPDGAQQPAGVMIRRNPGLALVWVTLRGRWTLKPDYRGGVLFDIGDPVETLWIAQGRPATREEVLASIDSGLPILHEMAEKQGPDAIAFLEAQHTAALRYVPA